ncbi:hypothetical protein BGZ58_004971, partial [Dissophora ornata]
MIFLAPELGLYLHDADIQPTRGSATSDHKVSIADLSVGALTTPTPQYILDKHSTTSLKVDLPSVKEEQWTEYAEKLETTLRTADALRFLGLGDIEVRHTQTSEERENPYLNLNKIDEA